MRRSMPLNFTNKQMPYVLLSIYESFIYLYVMVQSAFEYLATNLR